MDTSKSNEQFYKIRIEDLEKQLEGRNLKIDSLYKELESYSDQLARHLEKHQIVCEARDENKFRVVQLEKDVTVLKNEIVELKSQLKEQKEIKNSRELSMEAVVASYADQIAKYEGKIEAYTAKISQFETEKSASTSLSEKSFEKRYNTSNNEDNFKILQLESDIKLLSLENEDLKSKLGEEKERKNCTDKLQKYEQTIKEYEIKMNNLEIEKKEIGCSSEGHLNEIKKLQAQLESHQNCEKKFEEEKAELQKELENLKSLCKKQTQAETAETKIMPEVEITTRAVLELQECLKILTSFDVQQRNLLMKLQQDMKDKLQQIQETIPIAEKEPDVLKEISSVILQDARLQKAENPEELQEKVEKKEISTKSQKKGQQKTAKSEAKDLENQKMDKSKAAPQKELQEEVQEEEVPVRTPLKPQNRRQPITTKTEVKNSKSLKTVKPNAGNAVSHKKNTRKNKKVEDENVHSPVGPKDSGSENNKTAVENVSPITNQGRRQLRTRRKV